MVWTCFSSMVSVTSGLTRTRLGNVSWPGYRAVLHGGADRDAVHRVRV
jgi:hypothetical protein